MMNMPDVLAINGRVYVAREATDSLCSTCRHYAADPTEVIGYLSDDVDSRLPNWCKKYGVACCGVEARVCHEVKVTKKRFRVSAFS